MKNKSLFLALVLSLLTLLLIGCTEQGVAIPYTNSQLLARSTCINVSDFDNYNNGFYDGNLMYIDSNKICFIPPKDLNFLDANIPWSTLIEFPSGCNANQAVRVVGNTLVCVDLTVDTNIWNPGVDQNVDMNNFYINNLGDPFDDHDATTRIWVENLVSNLNQKFFLTDTASGISDYFDTNLLDPDGVEVNDAHLGVVDDEYLRGWISPVGNTPSTLITGLYDFHVHVQKTNGGSKDLRIYYTIVVREADTTETVIGTSELSGLITDKGEVDIHVSLLSDVDVASDSRIIGKVYASVSGGGVAPNVTLYFEGTTASHFSTPTNEQTLSSVFVRQDGTKPLTGDWNSPDYNITAKNISGVNTGDQDLSGYLLNTTDTFTGVLNIDGNLSVERIIVDGNNEYGTLYCTYPNGDWNVFTGWISEKVC